MEGICPSMGVPVCMCLYMYMTVCACLYCVHVCTGSSRLCGYMYVRVCVCTRRCVSASFPGEETLVIACMIQTIGTGAKKIHVGGKLYS